MSGIYLLNVSGGVPVSSEKDQKNLWPPPAGYLLLLLERLPDRLELLCPELWCPDDLCDELLCAHPADAQPRARNRLNTIRDFMSTKWAASRIVLRIFAGPAKGIRRESLFA
jgi:hypothetical protein